MRGVKSEPKSMDLNDIIAKYWVHGSWDCCCRSQNWGRSDWEAGIGKLPFHPRIIHGFHFAAARENGDDGINHGLIHLFLLIAPENN